MAFTLSQLKTDLSRRVAPADPSDSKDFYGAVETSAYSLLSKIKPKELSRRAIIENALYDQVNRYSCPEDLDTNKIMQWYRMALNNGGRQQFLGFGSQVSNRSFDAVSSSRGISGVQDWGGVDSAGSLFTIEYQSGKKFIKVIDGLPNTGLTISNMNSISDDNGTWNTFGNVVNLATDNLTYLTGTASLRFDINTTTTTGGLENYNLEAKDLSEYLNVGKVFTWLDIPNQNQIQTITIDLFSSLTDYYSITVSSPHDVDQFQLGQNMLGFALDREVMNTVGSPNPQAITGVRFTFVTNGTLQMNSVRMDNIVARKGHVYGVQYISNQMFQDTVSNLWKSRPTLDSDIIHVEYDTYNLLLDFCTVELANELMTDSDGRQNIRIYEEKLGRSVMEYKKRHKEEFIDETQTLRNFGVPYGYYGGRGFGNGGLPQNRNS